jgi:hypothetical protein
VLQASWTDHPHGLEAASLTASLDRLLSIMDNVLAILDGDDPVIARMANTKETSSCDDDSLMLAFSSSRNMSPAKPHNKHLAYIIDISCTSCDSDKSELKRNM